MMILAQRNNSILMKNRYKLLVLPFFSIGLFSSLIENISAQEEILLLWLKTTAVWWGGNKISDQYVIHDELDAEGIFIDTIDEQQKIVVSWIKVTALWWGQDKISDQDFINALQYLV